MRGNSQPEKSIQLEGDVQKCINIQIKMGNAEKSIRKHNAATLLECS